MMGARRRLEAVAEEAKRLLRESGQLEEGMRAIAERARRLRESHRSSELLRRVEAEVRMADVGEMAVQRVQIGIQIASTLGLFVLQLVGETTNSANSEEMKLLSAALDELAKPVPVGEVRVVIHADGDVQVLEVSQLAREGKSEDEIMVDLRVQGCRVLTWEQFASQMQIRIRQLEAAKLVARPLFELQRRLS